MGAPTFRLGLSIIGLVLAFCFLFPLGVIRNTDFDPEYYLVANREGAANCQTTIILGVDNTFVERSVCFGVDRELGTYKVKNDTAFLTFDDISNFGSKETIGIIELKEDGKKGNYGYFNYYKTASDDKPMDLIITKLKK